MQPTQPSTPILPAGSANPCLFTTLKEKKELEARNGLRQFDEVCRLAETAGGQLNLTSQLVCQIQYLAIEGIYTCAGRFRTGGVEITESLHKPPPPTAVPGYVRDMCDAVNSNTAWSPVRSCAYLMWRLNWIHPFNGGNGRSSRAIAYYALCARLGFALPGTVAIPEIIQMDRRPYYKALAAADAADRHGDLDLNEMERVVEGLLARQLLSTADHAARMDFLNAIADAAKSPRVD